MPKWQNQHTWAPGSRGGKVTGKSASFCENLSSMHRELESRIAIYGVTSQIVQDQKVNIAKLIASFNCEFCHNAGLEAAGGMCKFCLDERILLYNLGYLV